MSPAKAKSLIQDWRNKAGTYKKMEFLQLKSNPALAKQYKALADCYIACAEQLDQAFGRLS